jgi:hypothetical protein
MAVSEPTPRAYRYFDLIVGGFVAVLLCSNLIGASKVALVFGIAFGVGNIFFPISYIFGDVLTEVYGYARARRAIWAGFAAMVFAALMTQVVLRLPADPSEPWNATFQPALEIAFGSTWRIVLASILAFVVGDFVNRPRAAVHLAAITGVDLARTDDRMQEMMEWWGRHKDKSQAEWFLAAVRELGINTSLEAAHLQPRAGVQGVPELTRILTATDRPHLRLLALALLRDTTQRDFGTVSVQAPPEELIALADRYRFYAESLAGSGK